MKNINSRYSTMFNASIEPQGLRSACVSCALYGFCYLTGTAQTNRIKIFIFSIDIVLSVLQNMNSSYVCIIWYSYGLLCAYLFKRV